MQKTLFLLVLTILAFTVQSQDQGIKLGLHISPNLTNNHASHSGQDIRKLRFDFAAGVDIEVPIGSRMTLKSGLEYEGKGEKLEFQATLSSAMPPETKRINISYDYLQIPLLASYKVSKGTTHLYLDLGPYAGYLLSANIFDGPLGAYEGGEFNQTNEHKSFEFGIISGLGLSFPISDKIEGNIAIQDHLGLTNINKPFRNYKAKTHTIGLRLGTMLRL